LDVLRQIHPGLRCDGWLQGKFRTLREVMPEWYEQSWRPSVTPEDHDALHGMPLPTDNTHHIYLALLAYRLILPELDTLGIRLKLARDDVDLLRAVAALRDEIERFQVGDVRPSEVYHLLASYSGPTILITWVATDSMGVREYLSRYWQDYRHVKPVLTGDDLKSMGFSPGPIFGRVLGALRDARLDGQIATKQEEEQMAREMLDMASAS
jgi:hypothetical protein